MLAGRARPARFVCVLYMVLCAKERITGCCAGTGRAGARRTRKREKWTPALALAPKSDFFSRVDKFGPTPFTTSETLKLAMRSASSRRKLSAMAPSCPPR